MNILQKVSCHFNSRPHEEVDNSEYIINNERNISTHDLTKRSTFIFRSITALLDISTHDLTKRSTLRVKFIAGPFQLFQLTTSRRGRPCSHVPFSTNKYFNSRPHEEVDLAFRNSQKITFVISTHDLTKRSTTASTSSSLVGNAFQLTTSRRGRLSFIMGSCVSSSFQLTTSRRGRR